MGVRVSTQRVISCAAVLLLVFAAFLSTDTRSLRAHPHPAADYASAMVLANSLQRGDSAATAGGKSIIRVHGRRTPRVFVFFHGFSNSPRQYLALADSVYGGGDNVVVPRLPWHGLKDAKASNLGHITAEQLRDVADQTIDIAAGLGDTVVVFGVSMGGNLAAWVAQFRPVYRAVIAAPALGLSHLSSTAETPTINLLLRAPNYSKGETSDRGRVDRTMGWSTRGVGAMLKLGLAVRREADHHAPAARDIRVLANASDHTVNRSVIDELAREWIAKGAAVKMYELSDTLKLPHDIVDPDEKNGRADVTHPVILSLVHGGTPPGGSGAREVLVR